MDVVRRIRENIHGTIDISALEDLVIGHPFVQRMRRIKQLAFLQYVFPGASHSRFEHSLGVMHLAGVAWHKLADNQRALATSTARYQNFPALEQNAPTIHGRLSPTFGMIKSVFDDPYPLQAVRLAALLHDLGHSPYSHSGEGFMPTWEQARNYADKYPDYIAAFVRQMASDLEKKGRDITKLRIRHEIYTLLLIDEVLGDIYKDHEKSLTLKVHPQDVAAIIATEIPPVPGSPLCQFGIQAICHELVSGELDVDRMDYLLRDSRECGVVYGIFDESRILNSLAVYWDDKSNSLHLAIHFSGLAAFEDYLRARHSMYLQLYFHKTSVAAEAMIQRLTKMLDGWTLPLDPKQYAAIDETNFSAILSSAATTRIKDDKERDYFDRLVRDLMYDRNLWKRVFEVASNAHRTSNIESIDEAATVIAGLGVRFEKVSSTNSLTRFRPRDGRAESSNYMRLIKKDDFQFPRVIPIEDQLSLIDANSQVHITRIYVETGKDKATGRAIPDLVKEELQKLIQ